MEKELQELVTKKKWFECATCRKKLEIISIAGASTGFDMFGTGEKIKAFYCNNKECEKFGYLTLGGVKVEES